MKSIKLVGICLIVLLLATGCFSKNKSKDDEVIINEFEQSYEDVQNGIKLSDVKFENTGNSFRLDAKVTNTTKETTSFKVVLNLVDKTTGRLYGSNDVLVENLEPGAQKVVEVYIFGSPESTDTYEVIIENIE